MEKLLQSLHGNICTVSIEILEKNQQLRESNKRTQGLEIKVGVLSYSDTNMFKVVTTFFRDIWMLLSRDCIHYFSVSVIIRKDQKHLRKRRVCLDFQFQRQHRKHRNIENKETNGKHCGRMRKLRDVFSPTCKRRVQTHWVETMNIQGLHSGTHVMYQGSVSQMFH